MGISRKSAGFKRPAAVIVRWKTVQSTPDITQLQLPGDRLNYNTSLMNGPDNSVVLVAQGTAVFPDGKTRRLKRAGTDLIYDVAASPFSGDWALNVNQPYNARGQYLIMAIQSTHLSLIRLRDGVQSRIPWNPRRHIDEIQITGNSDVWLRLRNERDQRMIRRYRLVFHQT